MKKTVTIEDFKELFKLSKISDLFQQTYDSLNFHYEDLTESEVEETLEQINLLIDTDTQKVGTDGRRQIWYNGWIEVLEEFRKTKSAESLIPKFIRTGEIVKYRQKYIRPEDPYFELNVLKMIQVFLSEEYLKDCDHIYDFGCGSGINTIAFCQLFPDKKIHSFDFVDSAIELVKEIAKEYKFKIDTHLFDLTQPDYAIKIQPNSAVLTMGSIEQIPGKIKPFFQYLLKNKPKICIHMEPVVDIYDHSNPIDCLAYKFHMKRGHPSELLSYLQELENERKIKDLNVIRSTFGAKFSEGYTFIIWRSV